MMSVQNDLYQQQPMSLPLSANTSSQIDQEFTQINQQIQGLSLQYQSQPYDYGNTGVEATQSQHAEVNSYDSPNHYAQQNLYEPQPQTDYYGQNTQPNEPVGSDVGGYSEQQPAQMYPQQTYNDPLAYNTPNYGAAEVNFAHIYYFSKSSTIASCTQVLFY